MSGVISIGELRQNPTHMLREVRGGATYTITDRGEPVAEVSAVSGPRWVRAEDLDSLLRELGADERWAREIDEDRAADDIPDPWAAS